MNKRQYSQNKAQLLENFYKRVKLNNGSIVSDDKMPGQIKPFISFAYKDDYGIPARFQLLDGIDVQNIEVELFPYFGVYKAASQVDFCHAYQYLSAREFNRNLLCDKTYDHVVDAIVSYLLEWNDESMLKFISLYPQFENMCRALMDFKMLDSGAYVYDYCGVPVVKTTIKIIKSHFINKRPGRNFFDWMFCINRDFITHIKYVYSLLLSNSIDKDAVDILESDMPIPYKLPTIDMENLKNKSKGPNALKFITGEACCLKTTILNRLSDVGWKPYSRRDVGSFGGKSDNPVAVGNLHAALHYMLTQSDVIGDRGFIDNILWVFIMSACDPNNKHFLVRNLLSFLNSNFNEPSIAEFITQKGVVFLDPFVAENRARQLARCEDGDPWRGRLEMYTIAQFITYYVAARLFGWKVMCVPYTLDRKIDNERYNKNIKTIIDYFGEPIRTEIPHVQFSKPSNAYKIDNTFPKSVGIFK